jgi:hypothetical protein
LIDIRALASLARQTQPRVASNGGPAAQSGGYPMADSAVSFGNEVDDDDARAALMSQSAFGRVDSLAPVSNAARTSNVAVPLAILGGCALVAAAVFAAILIARPSRPSEAVAVAVPAAQEAQDSVGATAQPVHTPESPQGSAPGAEAPPAAEAAPAAQEPAPGTLGPGVIAAGKARRQPRGSRTASDEKKSSAPEEKTKPKKEEKSEPPSLDEVMLADQPKPKKEPPAEPAKAEPRGGTDIDTLLGSKPAKQPAKSRSIDDLLSGAVDKNAPPRGAPAPAPAPAAAAEAGGSDLPEAPSRDETLAAMRGVESAVRACAAGQSVQGTAEVQMTVSGSTGRVTTANVNGITGAVGSCIARAVRSAKFPHFTKPTFAIKYPYRF